MAVPGMAGHQGIHTYTGNPDMTRNSTKSCVNNLFFMWSFSVLGCIKIIEIEDISNQTHICDPTGRLKHGRLLALARLYVGCN